MTVDWLRALFDTIGFLTRGQCGPESETLKRISIAANGSIALAHLLVAVYLYVVWRRFRADIQYAWMFLVFTNFIVIGGLTHVCDIAAFWWPGYKLFTMINVVTALLSVYTMFLLPWMTKTALTTPSPALFRTVKSELEQAIALKEKAINDSMCTIAALRRQVDHLERMRTTGLWVAEQESALRELTTTL